MISLAIILQLSTKPTPALAVAVSLLLAFIRCHPTLQTDGEKAAFKIQNRKSSHYNVELRWALLQ